MPRIFISVLAPRRRRRVGSERAPPWRLAPLGTPSGPRERRQHNEVHAGEQDIADEAGDGGGDPQISIPQPRATRPPDVTSLQLRREAAELLVAVVHVKDFVPQDFLEDRERRRVVGDAILIDRKAAGRSFFRDVEKGEQPRIPLVLDDEVIESVSARQRIAGKEPALAQAALPKQRLATLAEQHAVMQFVDRVLEIETAQ